MECKLYQWIYKSSTKSVKLINKRKSCRVIIRSVLVLFGDSFHPHWGLKYENLDVRHFEFEETTPSTASSSPPPPPAAGAATPTMSRSSTRAVHLNVVRDTLLAGLYVAVLLSCTNGELNIQCTAISLRIIICTCIELHAFSHSPGKVCRGLKICMRPKNSRANSVKSR